ncbi:MAG: hypothetical protein M1840_005506 [Geoglossum simile]|nr:MAG: hypothetical protein M1840_005506 [Geoglossum simile]
MYYDWSNKTLRWPDMTVQLSRMLSERFVDNLGECVIVACGRAQGIDVIVKLRADPKVVNVDDHDRGVALTDFLSEWAALEDSSGSGHTPRPIYAGATTQDSSMPYSSGYIRAIIMSTVPGQEVGRILLDLSESKQDTIRRQLASTLEYMRKKGWYLVDLASARILDKSHLDELVGDEVTPESNVVEMFGVWDDYARR